MTLKGNNSLCYIMLLPFGRHHFVGVRWWGVVKWECGRRKCEFSPSIAISSVWSSPLTLHIEIYTASRGFPATVRLLCFQSRHWVNQNWSWQNLTVSMTLVLKSFVTKSINQKVISNKDGKKIVTGRRNVTLFWTWVSFTKHLHLAPSNSDIEPPVSELR